jgi:pyruvate dehydrogenase E1 component
MSLGTDGYGRSDSRRALRSFFEIDARYITLATLYGLHLQNKLEREVVAQAVKDLKINPEKANPMIS